MKSLYLSLLLLLSVTCRGQETYFLKADFSTTPIKDSALLICTIGPRDAATGTYPFTQTFNSGELYTSGRTTNAKNIVFDIESTEYYLTGKPMRTTIYSDRKPARSTTYYPEGNVYLIKELTYKPDTARPAKLIVTERILTCNGRDGRSLTINGNGTYITYLTPRNAKLGPERFSNFESAAYDDEQGPVLNGNKNSTWTGTNTVAGLSYTEEYNNGQLVSGTSTDRDGVKHNYTQREKAPEFPMGLEGFSRYVRNNIVYPASSKAKITEGRVLATFLVDLEGAVTDIGILRAPDAAMASEAIRILRNCPRWTPGQRHGALVNLRFSVPILFVLQQ